MINEVEEIYIDKYKWTTHTVMKNIIYLLISLLCIAGAFEFEEAADRDIAIDNDLDEYYHRNLRFRTDVRTCEDGYICYRDSDCDPRDG